MVTVLCAAARGTAMGQVPVEPLFQLQPGLTTANFISTSEETSTTAFIVRFQTRFPMQSPWFQPVIGATFTPYGSTGFGPRDTDAPTIFAGNIFTLLDARRGRGWFAVEVPILITHAPGAATTGSARDYGRDLVVQPTLYVHVGRKLFAEFGAAWSRLDVLVAMEQNLTPNRNTGTDTRDHFSPVAMIGASLTLGGPTPR
jgi:hypothetical protein